MAPNRKARNIGKLCTNLAVVPESLGPSAEDPELEAILAGTESKTPERPVDTESNKQPELEPEEDGTPVSVYVGCLVPPPPTVGANPLPTPPLCRRRPPADIERYHRSHERFRRRAHKIKKWNTEAMTRTRAARDIKKIYAAMRKAKLDMEPLCIKRLFEQDSD